MSPELDHGIVERLQLKVDNLREQNKRHEQRIAELEGEHENVSCPSLHHLLYPPSTL
jgi:hypothetical protein